MELHGTRQFREWLGEAGYFQKDKQEKFQRRDWDLVQRCHLGEKIEAALCEVGNVIDLKDDIKILANRVLRNVYHYKVRFIYVHVILSGDYSGNYFCDVVCVINDGYSTVWIATDRRTYQSWDDYFENNTLPKGWMCYPKFGKYLTGHLSQTIGIELTPSARLKAVALEALDGVAQVVSTVSDIATVASIIAFPVLGFAAVGRTILKKVVKRAVVASVVSNGYTATRTVVKIADRYKHNQSISLNNAEARELWVNAVVHGFSTLIAGGVSFQVLRTGSIVVSGAAKSAIAVNGGLKVFRVNLILALDACYTDSSYGKMTLTDFKRKLLRVFNILSPHHFVVDTLREIDELTSFLNIIGGKARNYLKVVAYDLGYSESVLECKPVTYIKQFIQIVGKFFMNMKLEKFENLIKQLKKTIDCTPKNYCETFDLIISEVSRQFLSAMKQAWAEAKREVYKYGENEKDLLKRSDLNIEDVRIIRSMLNDIEECYGSGSMKTLINKMDDFLSSLPDCNRTEHLKRIRCFCSFVKKETESKIVERFEQKKLIASLNNVTIFPSEMENIKENSFRQVIDYLNIEECVKAYSSTSSSSVPSVEACGISMYFFVESKPKIEISQYLNMLKEKTSGKFNFSNHPLVIQRDDIITIQSSDEKDFATFYTQRRGQELEVVLICLSSIEKKYQ